eukprot:g1507.t1
MQEHGIKGQYLHVTQIHPLQRPSVNYLCSLDQLMKDRATPDCFDALTVGTDHLKKRINTLESTKGVIKRLVLISDFSTEMKLISASFQKSLEGTLSENEIQVEVFWMKLTRVSSNLENPFYSPLADLPMVSIKPVLTELELLSLFPVQPWGGVSLYRGTFCIGNDLNINIKVYKQTRRARMPPLKNYCPNVSKVVNWRKVDNPVEVVPDEFHIMAYYYGADLVPIAKDQLESLSYCPEKGIQLIGFIKVDRVPRHHYLKEAFVVLSDTDASSRKAWSALAQGCRTEGTGMLARVILRRNASITVAILVPQEHDSELRPDSFIMNILPFSDDVRGFHFGSFANKKSLRPNEEQIGLMEELIRLGKLDNGQMDQFNTDKIANPTLHRMYRFLGSKASNSDYFNHEEDRLTGLVFEPKLESFDKELLVLLSKAVQSFKKPESKPIKQDYEDWKCKINPK